MEKPTYLNTRPYQKILNQLIPEDDPDALKLGIDDDRLVVATNYPKIAYNAWEKRDILPPQYGLQIWLNGSIYGYRPSLIRQFETSCEIPYIVEARDKGELAFHLYEDENEKQDNWALALRTPDKTLLKRMITDSKEIGHFANPLGIPIVRFYWDNERFSDPCLWMFATRNALPPQTFFDALKSRARDILELPSEVELTLGNSGTSFHLVIESQEMESFKYVLDNRFTLARQLQQRLGIRSGLVQVKHRGNHIDWLILSQLLHVRPQYPENMHQWLEGLNKVALEFFDSFETAFPRIEVKGDCIEIDARDIDVGSEAFNSYRRLLVRDYSIAIQVGKDGHRHRYPRQILADTD